MVKLKNYQLEPNWKISSLEVKTNFRLKLILST